MKKPVILLLFLLASIFLQARDLPKLNLQMRRKYIIETVYHEDTSRVNLRTRYDKKKFEFEVVSYDLHEKTYDISLVISYFLHVAQTQKGQEWIEDEVYETGFPTTYRSPVVYLNMFRVPVGFKLTQDGKIISFERINFGSNKTPEGHMINMGEWDKKSLESEIAALFFNPHITRSDWTHQMDVRSNYKIIRQNELTTEVLITEPNEYVPDARSSFHQYHRQVFLDNATGLIIQDKLSFIWKYSNPQLLGYPRQGSRSGRATPVPYEQNKFITRHQRLIVESSEPFEIMQRTGLSTYDNVQIQNPNTTLRIIAPDSAGYSRYLYLSYMNQPENSLKTFRLEKDENGVFKFQQQLDSPQEIYLHPSPTLPRNMAEEDLYLSPGDDLSVEIKKSGDPERFAFNGIGADENQALQTIRKIEFFSKLRLNSFNGHPLVPFRDSILHILNRERSTLHPDFYLYKRNTLIYSMHLAGQNTADTVQKYAIPVVNTLATKNDVYLFFLNKYIISFIQKATNFSFDKKGTLRDYEKFYSFAQITLPEPVLSEFLAWEVELLLNFGDWESAKILYDRHQAAYSNTERFKQTERIYRQNELLAPGRPFPIESLTDISGTKIDFSSIKDKVMILMIKDLRYIINNKDRQISRFPWQNYKTQYATLLEDIVPVQLLIGTGEQLEKIKPSLDTTGGVHYALTSYDELYWAYGQPVNLKRNRPFVLGRKGMILFDQAPGYSALQQAIKEQKNPFSEARNRESTLKIMVIVLLSVIFSIGLTFLLYRQITKRRLRKAELIRKMRELELSVIRTQMNPHFMYNCLNSIQNLLYKNQNDDAHLYLSRFASLVRQVLNNSKKSEIPLSKELESIREYIGLEQLRFSFEFKLETGDEINPDNIFVPPMLLQPFVENAILHGLSAKKTDRKLEIRIFKNQNRVELIVEDNGVGRQAAVRSEGNGQGILLSQNRLALLTEKTGIRYDLQITDLFDNNGDPGGTRVSISFTEED
ncbi:MAG: histidine kinase [Prolixibacteraceae bacterium]